MSALEPSTKQANGVIFLQVTSQFQRVVPVADLLFQEQIEADLPSVSVTANAKVH